MINAPSTHQIAVAWRADGRSFCYPPGGTES